MEFRETLLAAQRNQQQKSSENAYYKARFDPPKKEQKQKDKLSANIQKFLAKKEEEENRKKLEAQKKRDELLAMRDPKAIRKIQKTLKVIKSANKSVLKDAVDTENTAVTREGPDQPDQDDYGYESQEAAALYEKMMQKYSKIPDEPKFPMGNKSVKKDINGTIERVKHALQHEDDPVPHKRRRKKENEEKEPSPPPKSHSEKKRDEKPDKPKIRRPAPPPLDFNQLLKLAEEKKKEPIDVVAKKVMAEPEPERLMTKKQKKEYEEEMARRQRRQERLESQKAAVTKKAQKDDKPIDKDKKAEVSGFGRIPKLTDKNSTNNRNDSPKLPDRDRHDKEKAEKLQRARMDREKAERDKERLEREKTERDKERLHRERAERDKERIDRERLEKLKAERERIERDIDRLNRDRDRLEKAKLKLESNKIKIDSKVDRTKINPKEQVETDMKKRIDLKSQNTYRIDKNSNEKKVISKISDKNMSPNHIGQGKPVPKLNKEQTKDKILTKHKDLFGEGSPKLNGHNKLDNKGIPPKKIDDRKHLSGAKHQVPNKISNSFDFDKHVSSLGKNGQRPSDNSGRKPDGSRQFPPGDVRRKLHSEDLKKMQKRRTVPSDSEYDSEMDDFIDDGPQEMDYSKHIKEIFGYDKSKYRDIDDYDDPEMESSFARQQREEYISKKIGIMEDLEDMRMEAMEKKKAKKKRRISDD